MRSGLLGSQLDRGVMGKEEGGKESFEEEEHPFIPLGVSHRSARDAPIGNDGRQVRTPRGWIRLTHDRRGRDNASRAPLWLSALGQCRERKSISKGLSREGEREAGAGRGSVLPAGASGPLPSKQQWV